VINVGCKRRGNGECHAAGASEPSSRRFVFGVGVCRDRRENGRHSAGEASLDRRSEEYSHPERRTVLHRTFADAEWRAVGVEALDGAAALNACIPTPAG